LKKLSERLQDTVLKSRKPTTTTTTSKYLGGFNRWKLWVQDHKLQVFPAKECHVVLYLQHLAETKSTKAPIEEVVNALNSLSGQLSPTSSPFAQAVLDNLRRAVAKPVNHSQQKCVS